MTIPMLAFIIYVTTAVGWLAANLLLALDGISRRHSLTLLALTLVWPFVVAAVVTQYAFRRVHQRPLRCTLGAHQPAARLDALTPTIRVAVAYCTRCGRTF